MQEIDDLDEIQDHHGMDDNQIKENKTLLIKFIKINAMKILNSLKMA